MNRWLNTLGAVGCGLAALACVLAAFMDGMEKDPVIFVVRSASALGFLSIALVFYHNAERAWREHAKYLESLDE